MIRIISLKKTVMQGNDRYNYEISRSSDDVNTDIAALEKEGYEYFDKLESCLIFSKEEKISENT